MVPTGRLELRRIAPLAPQASVSTNSTTSATRKIFRASRDPAEQERFIRDAEAGMVTINGMVTSYPQLPFGGVKRSGYGRELSAHGIREFCNLKSVWAG